MVARLDQADAWVARARLLVFVLAAALAFLAFGPPAASARWLLAPLAGFVALVVAHDCVFRARDRARRAVAFHEAALDRMAGRFAGKGVAGERFADPRHPYAQDLDLFGRGSPFELICAARTRAGEERLAAWLLAPAGAVEVAARQRAVRELAPRLDLREDAAVLGEDVRAGVDPAGLSAWGTAPAHLPEHVAPVAALLALAGLATGSAWAAGYGPLPFIAVLFLDWAFGRVLRDQVARVMGGLGRPAAELGVLALLLGRLEREPFEDPRLRGLQAALGRDGARASTRIARLVRITARAEWAHNQFFAPFAFVLQWTALHAVQVERWRARSGAAVSGWLEAVADLEALSSLAGYAYEHPTDVFPEVIAAGPGRPVIEGEAVRHPLLEAAVPNDIRLGGDGPAVLLVSGSNMSGKSTYLRTVGLSVVLALAGAPVRARRLRLTAVQPGATLRIQDSLQAGTSRFYAEITRLKELMDLARAPSRSSSCSTRSCTAPTATTGASGPRRWCAASSHAARWASSPPTIWR